MRSFEFFIDIAKGKEVASIAVLDGTKLLMGKRRDNGRWTLPGGHVDDGEDRYEAAIRELYEEAGIKADKKDIKLLGTRKLKTFTGKDYKIHAFRMDGASVKRLSHGTKDPDEEIEKWEWIETKDGLPEKIAENLHSPKNVVLQKIGLQKSFADDLNFNLQMWRFIMDIQKSAGRDKVHGGLADKRKIKDFDPKQLAAGKKVEMEHTNDPEIAEEIATDHLTEDPKYYIKLKKIEKGDFFIMDMVKAFGHKYLRKYQRNGKWIYIYHEGEGPGRRLSDEHLEKMGRIAEHHPDQALRQKMREMIESAQAHDHEHLDRLRRVADHHENPQARKAAHEHLKKLGIDRDLEKLEDQAHEAANADDLHKELTPADQRKWMEAIEGEMSSAVFGHLARHMESPYSQAVVRNRITMESVMRDIKTKKNPKDILDALHAEMKKIDSAQAGLPPSQNSEVNRVGGYGSMAYNKIMQRLESERLVPTKYARVHKMERSERTAMPKFKEHLDTLSEQERREAAERAEREAREAREKAEREAREMAAAAASYETHKDSVEKMSSYFGKILGEVDKRRLAKNIEKIFGSDFKFQRFHDHLQGHKDVEIRIGSGFMDGLLRGDSSFSVTFAFHAPDGRKITYANRSIQKHPDGSIEWHNGVFNRPSNQDLKRYDGMASGLYGGVENFLKEISKNWTGSQKENTRVSIGTAANSGWGDGYKGSNVWGKHFFEWENNKKSQFASTWKAKASEMLTRIGRESELADFNRHIDNAEYIYQFLRTPIQLTKAEAERAIGRSLDFDFNQIIEKKGKVDLGDIIMTHTGAGYGGATAYINKTTGRHGHLNAKRKEMYDKILPENRTFAARPMRSAAESERATATAAREAETRRTEAAGRHGISTSEQDHVDRHIRYWTRGDANIRITETRLRRMRSWSEGQRNYFLATARLTPAAKSRIRALGRAT